MKVGFIGAGRIAVLLAETLRETDGFTCYAVAARDLGRAQAFAAEHGFQKAYGSYEEMLQDPEVELVYVATPHSHHYEHMKLCIDYGKPILCEKAFTMNGDQARKIQEYAKEKGVYVAEAIWTRYMPSRKMINDVLESGIIGKVTTLTANLSYPITDKERIMEPELAGGALLDIGIYGLNFAMMHFGDDIESIETSVQFTDTGVDAMETITIFYSDGRMAVLTHSIYSRSDRKGIFHGDKGYVVVENINNPQSVSVYDVNDCLLAHHDVPPQISGYEYEFMESAERIRAGEIESASMPMDTTVWMMDLMDSIRESWGLVYPQEKAE